MQEWIKGTCFALAVAMAGPALAQDTATENADTETAADDAAGLSMGTTESDPAVGQPFVRDTFGAWELRCVKGPDVAEICQLYQLLRDRDGNSVAEFNLFPLPEGGQAVAGANIVTPLETLLTAQLRLGVDGGQTRRYPYSFCSQVGCFARIGLTGEELGQFRAGANANVIIVPAAAPNETVDLSLSLSGFTAGYNALVESEKARAAASE
jgi:invasion protein IalB